MLLIRWPMHAFTQAYLPASCNRAGKILRYTIKAGNKTGNAGLKTGPATGILQYSCPTHYFILG